MSFLYYLAVTYAGGFVIGMPLGLGLSFAFTRRLAPISMRIGDLVPADGSTPSPEMIQSMHLRRTSRVLVRTGCAVACGISAAAFIKATAYSPSSFTQFAFLLAAISFADFKVVYTIPSVIAFWLTSMILS